MVPYFGELVAAAAMRAAVHELIALAERAHDGQLSAMLASHGKVLGRLRPSR